MSLCAICKERPLRYVKTSECPRCYNRRYVAANREKVRASQLAFQRKQRARSEDRTDQMPQFDHSAPVTYGTAHTRVIYWRGKASSHACAHCDGVAKEWAYRGGSPRERLAEVRRGFGSTDTRVVAYSTDPLDYMPLCRSCHCTFDIALAKAR